MWTAHACDVMDEPPDGPKPWPATPIPHQAATSFAQSPVVHDGLPAECTAFGCKLLRTGEKPFESMRCYKPRLIVVYRHFQEILPDACPKKCAILRICLGRQFAAGSRCFEAGLLVAPRPFACFQAEACPKYKSVPPFGAFDDEMPHLAMYRHSMLR